MSLADINFTSIGAGIVAGVVLSSVAFYFFWRGALRKRFRSSGTRSNLPEYSKLTSFYLIPILGLASWLLYKSDQPQLGAISGVLAVLSPILGLWFSEIKSDLRELRGLASALSPKFVENYQASLSATDVPDHSLALVARELFDRISPAFECLSSSESLEDQAFFSRWTREVKQLKEGDRLLAVCGRKFWDDVSKERVDEYWDVNKEKAASRVLIQRVFVADMDLGAEGEFSPEIAEALQIHREFKRDLLHYDDGSGSEPVDLSNRIQIRQVDRATRDSLKQHLWLDAKFGFALVTRDDLKCVSLHRLKGGNLKGCLIYDPLVYSVFEEQFWRVWEFGREVAAASLPDDSEPAPAEGARRL